MNAAEAQANATIGFVFLIGLLVMIFAVMGSSKRLMAFVRIIGWTLAQAALVFIVVFVTFYAIHNAAAPVLAADLTDFVLAFGLLGNSIRQLRANRKERARA